MIANLEREFRRVSEQVATWCEMKTKSILNRKVRLAFGAAILILLVVGTVSYRDMVVSIESDLWVRHTHEVLENLQGLLSAMESVESSYRGFVLTGNESFVEDYRAGVVSVEKDEAAFRNLTADNPEQQRRLPVLESLVGQKVQLGERLIGLRRAKGLDATLDATRDRPGQRIMNEFQSVVRELQNEELGLLALRNADANRSLRRTKTFLIFGTVLCLLIATSAS